MTKAEAMPSYAFAMQDGDFAQALRHVERFADLDSSDLGEMGVLSFQSMADAALLLGREEEAEENYRKAQKLLKGSNDELRIFSCRNTGWLSLSVSRYGAALNCFSRITQDAAATREQKIEAIVAIAVIHHRLAQQAAAEEALAHAARLAAEAGCDARWGLLIDLLALDFSVQIGVRCAGGLKDHVFWQSAAAYGDHRAKLARFTERMGKLPARTPAPEIMAQRYRYLVLLQRCAAGERDVIDALGEQLALARTRECETQTSTMQLEIALAALAGNFSDQAEKLLRGRGAKAQTPSRRWNLDYMYCQAKICLKQGNAEEAMKFYAAYSGEALQCLRSETQVIKSLDGIVETAVTVPTDDVSARLPAKYRRAYAYILNNYRSTALTMREVAAHICVTERALQLAFKEHLGMSPSAVIRRLRLDAVRTDLLNERGGGDNIMETATRLGVKSRSALIRGYRKQFNESPSETILR
ncbi:MAG TPA: helix-turn-helix transcriptional regulator [Burkholderiaceae bacterium]